MTSSDPAPAVTADEWHARIEPRLAAVRGRLVEAGGDDVTLLAVSKGQPVEAVHAAVRHGLFDLGENYAQELAAKAGELAGELEGTGSAVRWHFIGQLQSNKVRMIAPWIDLWQSVDRMRIAREVAKRTERASVLLQVNLSRQDHKGGCSFDDVESMVDEVRLLGIDVQGLMGVGEAADATTTAAQFTRLRTTCDRLDLVECSIGMSADLEIAVECGSTMVRIGSDIFGPRQARPE